MIRLALVLVAALVGSSLYLVKTSYDSRRLYALLDRARAEEQTLAAERARLDAERQAQATHLRVEKTARERLRMRTASPDVTLYVPDTAASAAEATR